MLQTLTKSIRYIGVLSFMVVQVVVYPLQVYGVVNIAIINKGGSNTNVINSANGIPVININKVDGNGYSINEYDILDVGKEGIIFNNSSGLSDTELAGWIVGNSNLKEGESARLILNTVRSKRSELLGYMEVAGASADVIILNSNGIKCDGCGFLNTRQGILSTGEAEFNGGGKFVGIKTGKGEIEIGRGGFNGSGANRIDIISQQLRLNGVIEGREVNVNLGGSDYNHDNKSFVGNEYNEKTQYVISSNEFGGMYGDSIRLVSHNRSMGVNIDFNMATSSSKLEVDAAGNLIISGKLSSEGDMRISGADVEVKSSSELNSKQTINLNGDNLDFYGTINSNNLNIEFKSLYTEANSKIQTIGTANINTKLGNFSGSILGVVVNIEGEEINIFGDINTTKQLKVSGDKVRVNTESKINSEGDITFSGEDLNIYGRIVALSNLNFNSSNIYLEEGSVSQGKTVNINANNLDLKGGSSITSMGDFLIKLAGDFNLHEGVNFAANNNLSLSAYNINLYAGARLSSNGEMSLSGNNLNVGIGNRVENNNNKDTTISSKGNLNIDISEESNIETKASVLSSGLLTFRSSLINNRGLIAGDRIVFKVDYLNNLGKERIGNSYNSYDNMGTIYGIETISFEGYNGGNAKKILNSSSEIKTLRGDIDINADVFENTLTWWDIYERIGEWNTVYDFKEHYKYVNSYYNSNSCINFLGHDTCIYKYYDDYITKEIEDVGHDYRNVYYTYQNIFERDITYDIHGANGATLSSGGNINVNGGDFINRSSTISAVGSINIDVNNFRNETIAKDNYTEKKYEYFTHMISESNYKGNWHIHNYREVAFDRDSYEKIYTGRESLDTALISAGGDINIDASGEFDNGIKDPNSNSEINNNIEYETGSDINQEETIDMDFVDGNMFYESDGSNGYLIETNPDFKDLQKFKGSAYYLALLGLNPDEDLILGDGFVDLEVVGDQIMDETGKEILDGYDSKEDQLEGLMEAGMDAKDELGLVLGEALTEEQLKQLKQPIIWWVRKTINGHSVLVPQVFFPSNYNSNNNHNNGGSTITGGGDVNINVGGNANNGGNINGGGLVDINVDGNLENSGNIHGDEGVDIDVGGDFNNTGNISDANNGEEHQQNMEDMYNNIEDDITKLEEEQKEYEERASNYEKSAEEYNSIYNQYNTLMGSLNNKYAGKVWTGDIKLQELYNSHASEISGMEETLASLGNLLAEEGEYLNNKAEELNGLSDSIKLQVEELENYVDNIHGIEINVGGDFTQDGVIEGNKILAEINGRLSSVEGVMNGYFKTDISADSIDLVGARITGGEVNLNANEISMKAAERRNEKGLVSELIASEISGGSVNLNSTGEIYISSSNIMGNTVGIEAGKDIEITGQKLEHELSEEDLRNETVSYTNIDNTNEVLSGNAGELTDKYGDSFKISGYKEEAVGSNIVAGESLTMSGENIGIYGSTIYSEGLLVLEARDVLEIGTIEEKTNIDYTLNQSKSETHGAWHSKSKTITKIKDEGRIDYTHNEGSNIVGDRVYFSSGGDTNIIGSVVANTEKEEEEGKKPTRELEPVDKVGSKEINNTESKEENTSSSSNASQSQKPDNKMADAWEEMGSGEIELNSGGTLNIIGATDTRHTDLSTDIDVKEIGYGFGTFVDGLNDIKDAAKAYGAGWVDGFTSKEGFLNQLQNTNNLLQSTAGAGTLVSFNTSASYTNTHVDYESYETSYVGSSIIGGNVNINSNNELNIKGSNIVAKKDINMEAIKDINITAGENTFRSEKTYSSKTNSLNASIGVGVGPSGIGITGSASYGYNSTKGKDYETAKTYSGSTISAGGNANLSTGKDINLIGSNIYGENVNTDSTNLNVESLQNEYKSWGHSDSYGFTVGISAAGQSGGSGSTSGSIGASYGENSYEKYDKKTENVAGISANNNLTINANNNVNLKGATLDGKNSLNLNSNSLIIEDLKDVSYSHESGFNLGYTYSFNISGGNGNNPTNTKSDFVDGLNQAANMVDSFNTPKSLLDPKHLLSFSASANEKNVETITIVHGAINNTDNINVNSINGNYDYDTNDIFTNTQNNKEEVYHNESGYNITLAPSQTLSSISGTFNTVNVYIGSYYAMKDIWSNGSDLIPNLWIEKSVTGIDSSTKPEYLKDLDLRDVINLEILVYEDSALINGLNQAGVNVSGVEIPSNYEYLTPDSMLYNDYGLLPDSFDTILGYSLIETKQKSDFFNFKALETLKYDDSYFMNGINLLPGVQAWSLAHDYYLSDANDYRPFGEHTQLTIIPFFVMGTLNGAYGTIAKPAEWIIKYINGGNNK